jgi:hypothetical protein
MFQRETRKPRLRLLADTASTAPRGAGRAGHLALSPQPLPRPSAAMRLETRRWT